MNKQVTKNKNKNFKNMLESRVSRLEYLLKY